VRIVRLVDEDFVVSANKRICEEHGSTHIYAQKGRVSSALSTAFYPGAPPFVHGGIASVAGALFFYIVKSHAFFDANKRTAVIASIAFMEINGWTLKYPITKAHDALAELAEGCAEGKISMDEVKEWFENHKTSTL
jgi:death-on-curing protein